MNIDAYLQSLSNDELIQKLEIAIQDLEAAAEKEHGSEWHESCLAATVLYCNEMSKRGLKRPN
jgi:hypothetical protein